MHRSIEALHRWSGHENGLTRNVIKHGILKHKLFDKATLLNESSTTLGDRISASLLHAGLHRQILSHVHLWCLMIRRHIVASKSPLFWWRVSRLCHTWANSHPFSDATDHKEIFYNLFFFNSVMKVFSNSFNMQFDKICLY